MDYIQRIDKYKKEHCKELSSKDKLRTGYKTKAQLKQGLSSFIRYVPDAILEEEKLTSILFPDIRDKIRMGEKVSSGGDQLLAIYDDGISDNSLSERSYGTFSVSNWSDSGSEVEVPQIVEEQVVSMTDTGLAEEPQNTQLEPYSMGRLASTESIESPMRRLPLFEPRAPTSSGGRRRGAGRPSNEQRRIAAQEEMPISEVREVDTTVRELIEDVVEDL